MEEVGETQKPEDIPRRLSRAEGQVCKATLGLAVIGGLQPSTSRPTEGQRGGVVKDKHLRSKSSAKTGSLNMRGKETVDGNPVVVEKAVSSSQLSLGGHQLRERSLRRLGDTCSKQSKARSEPPVPEIGALVLHLQQLCTSLKGARTVGKLLKIRR